MKRRIPSWLVVAVMAASAAPSASAQWGVRVQCRPGSQCSTYTPGGATIGGVSAITHGYPPYYGPPYRGVQFGAWGWYRRPSLYWPSAYSYYGLPLNEVSRKLDPNVSAPQGTMPASSPPPEPADLGLEALRSHDFARAALIYERRVQERLELESAAAPADRRADRTAQRLLAIALLGSDRLAEAQTAIMTAYAEDSELAARGFDAKAVLGSAGELRRLLNRAVSYAHRTGSAEAWMMVSHLMSMEGREAIAQKMIERASGAKAAAAKKKGREPAHGPASFTMPKPAVPKPAAREAQ